MSAIAKGCGAGAVLIAGICFAAPQQGPGRYLVCDPNATPVSQNIADSQVPGYISSHPGTKFAIYEEGIGLSCDPPAPGYTDTGTKVNQTGKTTPQAIDNSGTDQTVYEYYTKS